MSKRKNQCTVACLFALRKKCICSCGGRNHGQWTKSFSPGPLALTPTEDKATLASDLSAEETLDRVFQGESYE